jgi:3-oxoacyl-[acyl-carrier protein] reductase
MTLASQYNLESRVALVTGGSRGIGRAIVAALINDGWQVAFTYRTQVDAAKDLEKLFDGRAIAFQLDLNDQARPDSLRRDIEAKIGLIQGLVNNAAIRFDGLLAMTTNQEWNNLMDTNVGGVFRCCRAVLPSMLKQRNGSIVNVSSLAALRGLVGQTAYSASKAALLGLTRSLAREMGKRMIRVNAVVPGYVETDMTSALSDQIKQRLRASECLPSGTTAEDVAQVVAFLLSKRAAAVTGQVIPVDAGSSA